MFLRKKYKTVADIKKISALGFTGIQYTENRYFFVIKSREILTAGDQKRLGGCMNGLNKLSIKHRLTFNHKLANSMSEKAKQGTFFETFCARIGTVAVKFCISQPIRVNLMKKFVKIRNS